MKKNKLVLLVALFAPLLFICCPNTTKQSNMTNTTETIKPSVDEIKVSVAGGTFTNDVTTKVSCATKEVKIVYTTDGSEPRPLKQRLLQVEQI